MTNKLKYRELSIDELEQIWKINRTEYVDANYRKTEHGLEELAINKTFVGWAANEQQKYAPILRAAFLRGAYFYGGFTENLLKAIVVLDSHWIGSNKNMLQLKFLHVDKDYRGRGIGGLLFKKAVQEAIKRGASSLYISSSETKNTVDFYRYMGCKLTDDIDQGLMALEPEDIHMEYRIALPAT